MSRSAAFVAVVLVLWIQLATAQTEIRYFADGGFAEAGAACVFPWEYTVFDENDNPVTTQISSPCISLTRLEPYLGGNTPPTDPTDGRTNRSMWCSTTADYVFNPLGNDKSARKLWGYCLDVVTVAPTPGPTSAAPTGSPTVRVVLADGGGVENETCVLPFTYNGIEYTDCASFEDNPPYLPSVIIEPFYDKTDKTRWCAVGNADYQADPPGSDKSARRLWGFCIDQADVAAPATFLADGGFQEEPVECAKNWQFKDGSGAELEDVSGVCISFDEQQPYGHDTDGVTLLEPTLSTTSKLMWCSTSDIYNPAPTNEIQNRKNWGYCFSSDFTASPTSAPTNVATDAPVTSSPTIGPTEIGPTSSPSETIDIVSFVYADGGFQSRPTRCAEDWQFKDGSGGKLETVSDICIPFSEKQPYGFDNSSGTLLQPTSDVTNVIMWCATSAVYNPAPVNTIENRENWGYCLGADFPFVTPAPTAPIPPTTMTPSVSPSTSSPTITAPLGDGGGVQGGRCQIPFTDVNRSRTFTNCVSIEEFPPYMPSTLIEPLYVETPRTHWCAVEYDEYIFEPTTLDKSRRKSWSYCVDDSSMNLTEITQAPVTSGPSVTPTTSSPTPLFVLKADGGGADEIRPCATQWSYKVTVDGQSENIAMSSVCISFQEFVPDLEVNIDPTHLLTDKTRWCATAEIYNPFPKQDTNQGNKLLWGYCLDESITPAPVTTPTMLPTPAPITPQPTDVVIPVTSSPTVTNTERPTSVDSTASPTIGVAAEIAKFEEEFGVPDFRSGTHEMDLPQQFLERGAVSGVWDSEKSTMNIVLQQECTSQMELIFQGLMTATYKALDFETSCKQTTRRLLQDSTSGGELEIEVCAETDPGDCFGRTAQPNTTDPSTVDIAKIVLPIVIVLLVLVLTVLFVMKRRNSQQRSKRPSSTIHKPQTKRAKFPRIGGLLGRMKFPRRGVRSDGSEVTTSMNKDSDKFSDYQNPAASGTDSAAGIGASQYQSSTTQSNFGSTYGSQDNTSSATGSQYASGMQNNNTSGTSYGASTSQTSGTYGSTTYGGATSTYQSQTATYDTRYGASDQTQTAASASTTASPNNTSATTSSSSPTRTTQDEAKVVEKQAEVVTPTKQAEDVSSSKSPEKAVEKKASTKKVSSSAKSKLTKMTCAKCSSSYYSASGKSKMCLNCRHSQNKITCKTCSSKFVSASGKSTECPNCRKKKAGAS